MSSKTFADLVAFLAGFTHDPYKFVLAAFPWGEKGTELEGLAGPDVWQKEVLDDIGHGLKDVTTVTREAVASGNGVGKAQRLDDWIDTPAGVRKFGDLRPGDYVFGADGKPTKILQCKLYHKIPFYRVRFDDDSFLDVSSGHVWNAKCRQDRRNKRDYQTLTTLDIIQKGIRRESGSNPHARQWEIPIQRPVEYAHKETAVQPYYMGVWLGDGCRRKTGYTKPYTEIQGKLESLGLKCDRSHDGRNVYVYGLCEAMRDYGILNLHSCERYVPDDFKYNSPDVRKGVLCGLLDTDGEITRNHSIVYSTTSERLAHDVLWLARSLGGKAQFQPIVKQGWYKQDGAKKICKKCYRLTLMLPFNPFTLEHRKERYKDDIQHRYRVRWIDTITPIGSYDGMCITVDTPDGMYLAHDFIATHNSCLVSWLILWAMATHEDTRGVVTANTESQLRAKTWPELSKWYRLFVARDMFRFTATSLFSVQQGHEKTWRVDAIPWSKENPEAFAGLHNQGKRILMIFDEASAIYDEIWNVAEGAMTDRDTEIVWCAFGNPTRNQGKFFDCFHRSRNVWHTKKLDSRTVAMSNKEQLKTWAEEYGEDSDFFKVHVRGEFPSASENQFISRDLAEAARRREPETRSYEFAPAVIGVDPAWTGEDMLAVVLRQGIYSKVLEVTPRNDNDMEAARRIARYQDDYSASAVFIDMGYGTGIYSAGKDAGRTDWRLVAFGEKSSKPEHLNKRMEMWAEMKAWLEEGGSIGDDRLVQELSAPEVYINRTGKQVLEAKADMKKRGLASPNIADALALTFAFPVRNTDDTKYRQARRKGMLRRAGAM